MAAATDVIANRFDVGDIVLVPCEVVAVGGSPQSGVANLTLTPRYRTPNDSTPSDITSVYATQVLLSK